MKRRDTTAPRVPPEPNGMRDRINPFLSTIVARFPRYVEPYDEFYKRGTVHSSPALRPRALGWALERK